jgi:hypothetical protein
MKNNLVVFVFLLPLFTLGQQEILTYDLTQDIKVAEQYENSTEIEAYTTKDGLTIRIGDTLTIGNAVVSRKKYLFNDVFSHIVIGNTKGIKNKEFRPLPHNYSGSKVVVKSLFVTHEKFKGYKFWPNRKQMPLVVNIFIRNLKGSSSLFSYSRKTILDIEQALYSGEIVNSYAPLSKEEAIKKLKESKDLMELDFLSKEEYLKLRKELTPIILDKKK